MRKNELLKQWRLVFKSSMVFYLGVLLIGLIPMVTFDDMLWERNWFFILIGLVFGLTIFIGLFVMLIAMFLSIWPALRKFDYLYIVVLILTLAVLDFESAFSESESIIFFSIVTVVVIALQLIARLIIIKSSEEDLQSLWDQGINKLKDVDHTKKLSVTRIMTSAVVIVVFASYNNFEEIGDQVIMVLLVLALSIYMIKLYHEIYDILPKHKVLNLVFFTCSYIGVLVIFYFLAAFFTEHAVLRAVMVLLPLIPYLWVTVPHFYTITWLEKDKHLTK